jgi:hypothetical protein
VSVFRWRLGRLGFARPGYDRRSAIGGWRHLWWRFWWELRPAGRRLAVLEPPPFRLVEPPEYRVPKGRVMHWSATPDGMAVCGAESGDGFYWTRELAAATCSECRRIGGPIELKHRLNSR